MLVRAAIKASLGGMLGDRAIVFYRDMAWNRDCTRAFDQGKYDEYMKRLDTE